MYPASPKNYREKGTCNITGGAKVDVYIIFTMLTLEALNPPKFAVIKFNPCSLKWEGYIPLK